MSSRFNCAQKWGLAILLSLHPMGADMSSASYEQKFGIKVGAPFETEPAKGRDFREMSVHPNSEELLFVECSRQLEPTGGCYVLRYHLTTKALLRYNLPGGYFYSTAKFSPRGTYVVMSRVPKPGSSEHPEARREAYDQTEIVYMKADGTEFRALPLAQGNKVAPIMSLDEARVAYWRSTLRRPGSKTFSSNFDIWEVNLETGDDHLFAGPFSFFERANLQYLSQDELLVGATGPAGVKGAIAGEYAKKYNNSEVYRIIRGVSTLPPPILTDIKWASFPSCDGAGTLYVYGDRPASSFVRKSTQGQIEQWRIPEAVALGGLRFLIAAPNGSYITFLYQIKGSNPGEGKNGMGLLNTQTAEWSPLSIPALQSSTEITVQAAN